VTNWPVEAMKGSGIHWRWPPRPLHRRSARRGPARTGPSTRSRRPRPSSPRPRRPATSDDFETDKGWVVNPAATDTATTGRWERAVPQATTSTGAKQLGTANSGTRDLVTGAAAGAAAGDNDIDGGVTSIQSPVIAIPAGGTVTLSLAFYFAHLNNSSADDLFRVQIIGAAAQTVLEELGSAVNDNAAWATRSVDISAFAGQSVRILISAADNAGGSLVEAGVDDVVITRQ
jgi:hypothetical protein